MPLYQYQCQVCGKVLSLILKTGEKTPACPNCGEESLKVQPGTREMLKQKIIELSDCGG